MPPTASRSKNGAVLSTASRAASGFSRFTRAKRRARRITFLVHRWLGIVIALLMAVWALSGIVMMYVAYPATSAEERAAGLDALDLSACCDNMLLPPGQIGAATVEMTAGEPMLRLAGPDGPRLVSLARTALPEIGAEEAAVIARTHMRNARRAAPAVRVEPVEVDQWTLQLRRYAPLFKASVADERGTVLYVSGLTGEVVQDTHASERFWNWLGAVPHWLYFTALRQNGPLWSQVVIYTSLLGVFLTVTGLYVGISMYGRGKRHSPYRGLAAWHHWTGLIFGVVTLTWVASGLFSMNPWGWFESEGPGAEIQAMAGRAPEAADAAALARALAANPQPGVVSAELAIAGSKPYAILVGADGSRRRAALPDLAPAPLDETELAALVRAAKPGTPIASAGPIARPDAYYYGHKEDVLLPAYRVIYADADQTRLYFDPATGELTGFADAPSRAFRWWHLGLHRLDFTPWLRGRPVWDIVTVPLMIGVSLLCLIGLWIGMRRLKRDLAGRPRGVAGRRE